VTIGCKGPTNPSDNQTQTFSGTVQPQSLDIKIFQVSNLGEIAIKLTALTPGNVFIGVAYGQSPDGVNCSPSQSNPYLSNANVGRSVFQNAIYIKGAYCVVVFDPVGVSTSAAWPVAQTYTLEVNHP
jgi:hypothetical protein